MTLPPTFKNCPTRTAEMLLNRPFSRKQFPPLAGHFLNRAAADRYSPRLPDNHQLLSIKIRTRSKWYGGTRVWRATE